MCKSWWSPWKHSYSNFKIIGKYWWKKIYNVFEAHGERESSIYVESFFVALFEIQEIEIKKIIDNYLANIDPNCTDLDIVRLRFMSSVFFDSKSVMHCEIVALATKCLHDIKSNQANFTQNFYQDKY